jgi:probable rRNA maturation factor
MRTDAELPSIRVRNLQRSVSVKTQKLEEFAVKALRLCLNLPTTKRTDLSTLRELFVLLISDRRMAGLHQQFLNESGPTDVITFSHGEIFISVETARRQARQFGNSVARELQLYVVHGLLHLHGFDDRTAGDGRRMDKIQKDILARIER